MPSEAKTSHIQIRISPAQKRELVRQARDAGVDLSNFILERVSPSRGDEFRKRVVNLSREQGRSFALAELGELLSSLGRGDFTVVVARLPRERLDDVAVNQLAAMVETAATRLGVRPPTWVHAIQPLRVPWFATALESLRLHLLCNSPPAFRRRNLFVDSTFLDRV